MPSRLQRPAPDGHAALLTRGDELTVNPLAVPLHGHYLEELAAQQTREYRDDMLVLPDLDQPRKAFDWDQLKELAASIHTVKQLVPVICRPHTDLPGHGTLVDGESRWRALPLVPCDTFDVVMVEGPLDAGQLLMMQVSLGVTSQRLDPVGSNYCAPCPGVHLQWVRIPPGTCRSSR
jgi:ParB-like nuclease domain